MNNLRVTLIRDMGFLFVSLALLALVFAPSRTADAQVGGVNFLEPLITEDPNPDNEIELQPQALWGKQINGYSFEFSFEKTITPNTSVMVAEYVNHPSAPRMTYSTGMNNMNLIGKWAFYTSDEHQMRFAIGPDVFLPTGQLASGAQSHARGGPLLMGEKAMGDLPRDGAWAYLRPIQVLADAAYQPKWSGQQSDLLFADLCLGYTLSDLAVSRPGLPIPTIFSGLVPFMEFDYQQVVKGSANATPPSFEITPALAYMIGPYQFTAGGQFGLNSTARAFDQGGVIVLLDISLDDLIPAIAEPVLDHF